MVSISHDNNTECSVPGVRQELQTSQSLQHDIGFTYVLSSKDKSTFCQFARNISGNYHILIL